ncbi:RES domain-containing protein [Geomonas propionica]|uniref:RES domain-containing protein n=1 Tax=Geomonas propionica TaxID=2798582 RepID=A0ABS0YMZ0_9BACT|nr:RES domain-containing protein [Geomonas propionica]MBJ6799324.1 RES domain-containing protein [Geomonas propionica]
MLPDEKHICHKCIGDEHVSRHIKKNHSSHKCSYCHKHRKAMPFEDLAEWVDDIYRTYYKPGELTPVWSLESDTPDFVIEGEPPEQIISEMLQVDSEVAEDLANYLSDAEKYKVHKDGNLPFFEASSCYEPIDVYDEHSAIWDDFCWRVKHKSRFYCEEAAQILKELFSTISKYGFHGGAAPIRKIGGSSAPVTIYRARRANTTAERIKIYQNPEIEMGPPPRKLAKAGRLNPIGIPVLYGAFEYNTCLAEIRLAVGEQAVTCGFDIVTPLTVLDLTAFGNVYEVLSMFDTTFANKASHLSFLRRFEDEVSKPFISSEEELEYIPTQALVEYLTNFHEPKIDAVIYSSPQTNKQGKNIAILNHAIIIEMAVDKEKIANSSSISEYYSEESVFILKDNEEKPQLDLWDLNAFNVSEKEYTLKYKGGSLQLHIAKAVNYQLETRNVHIYTDPGVDSL